MIAAMLVVVLCQRGVHCTPIFQISASLWLWDYRNITPTNIIYIISNSDSLGDPFIDSNVMNGVPAWVLGVCVGITDVYNHFQIQISA